MLQWGGVGLIIYICTVMPATHKADGYIFHSLNPAPIKSHTDLMKPIQTSFPFSFCLCSQERNTVDHACEWINIVWMSKTFYWWAAVASWLMHCMVAIRLWMCVESSLNGSIVILNLFHIYFHTSQSQSSTARPLILMCVNVPLTQGPSPMYNRQQSWKPSLQNKPNSQA